MQFILKIIKISKSNYQKYFKTLIFIYLISFMIGILGIFYIIDKFKAHKLKDIHIFKNYDKKISSLEYLLFFNKKNASYKINFFKNFQANINGKYQIKKFTNNFFTNPKSTSASSTGYFDIYANNKIIFASGDGIFGYFEIDNLDNTNFEMKLIGSNIIDFVSYQEFFSNGDMGVKDIIIDNSDLYISYNRKVKEDCYNISILKANVDLAFLNFENFFTYDECWNDNKQGRNRSGGRISIKDENNIFLTLGSFSNWKTSQDLKSIFGSIIEIEKRTKNFKSISKGHRNPQGLYYNNLENILISTDHGPKYGDEINVQNLNKNKFENFGWPVVSYGDHYSFDKEKIKNIYDIAPLYKSHKEYGFSEPVKYYDKNIAPSGIIYVGSEFSELDRTYAVSALGFNQEDGAKALYLINFNEDYSKIISETVIPIGERIRDLKYSKIKNVIIMFLESTSSFAVLKLNN